MNTSDDTSLLNATQTSNEGSVLSTRVPTKELKLPFIVNVLKYFLFLILVVIIVSLKGSMIIKLLGSGIVLLIGGLDFLSENKPEVLQSIYRSINKPRA